MVTYPYKVNILKWDIKQHAIDQSNNMGYAWYEYVIIFIFYKIHWNSTTVLIQKHEEISLNITVYMYHTIR